MQKGLAGDSGLLGEGNGGAPNAMSPRHMLLCRLRGPLTVAGCPSTTQELPLPYLGPGPHAFHHSVGRGPIGDLGEEPE